MTCRDLLYILRDNDGNLTFSDHLKAVGVIAGNTLCFYTQSMSVIDNNVLFSGTPTLTQVTAIINDYRLYDTEFVVVNAQSELVSVCPFVIRGVLELLPNVKVGEYVVKEKYLSCGNIMHLVTRECKSQDSITFHIKMDSLDEASHSAVWNVLENESIQVYIDDRLSVFRPMPTTRVVREVTVE